jgi:flavin-dependent dehydrogenase
VAQTNLFFDVTIIGAGPAGSTTALLLAREGFAVGVIDKRSCFDDCIGEVIGPQWSGIAKSLGLSHIFARQNHRVSPGTLFAWGSADLKSNDYIFNPQGMGWHLDRREFNSMLVDAAKDAGAEIIRAALVTSCQQNDGQWSLTVAHCGESLRIRSRFLIDAGGRASRWSALDSRRFVYDRLVGVSMFCERKADFPWTDCTLVEAIDQGWFYSVSIPGNKAVLVYMTDADLYAKGLRRSTDFFHEQLRKTVWTRKRMVAKASRRTLYSAVSSVREKVAGKNWMTVGDASRSFDPLSSQGILNAVRSGIDAANTILREPKDSSVSTGDYEDRNRRVFAEYLGTHRKFYGMEKRWPDSEFWTRRQCGFLSPLAA